MLVFLARRVLSRYVNDNLKLRLSDDGAAAVDAAISKILMQAADVAIADERKTIMGSDVKKIVDKLK